jgi:hypothetical protein
MVTVPSEDAGITRRERAMELLQTIDDGLSTDNKVALISKFMKDAVVIDTYLSLTDVEVRRAWLSQMLDTIV